MKQMNKKIVFGIMAFLMLGCTQANDSKSILPSLKEESQEQEADNKSEPSNELTVRFGREGTEFTLNLHDNDTAKAISRYVGTSEWNLPIYHYDDYENYEVMQYYDIPDRYEIPSNAEIFTHEKAGQVYYSEPNRIVLFYQDANVQGEYTPLGYFDVTEEWVEAIINNPVVEGWSNKIISIESGK